MSNRDLANKTVFVTGALGGIGMATANRLAEAGAELMLADLRPGEAGVDQLLQRGAARAEMMTCDVADEAAVAALVEATLRAFGKIDAIVNVAGAMIYKPIAELTPSD